MKLSDPAGFANEFIEEYMHDGFASLSKKDIDILILHLLRKHSKLDQGNWDKPNYGQLAIELRISEQKIRNNMREVLLRYGNNSEEAFIAEFKDIFDKDRFIIKDSYVILSSSNPVFHLQLKSRIEQCAIPIFDNSFNKDIIKLLPDTFAEITSTLTNKKQSEIIKSLPDYIVKEIKQKAGLKDIILSGLNDFKGGIISEAAGVTSSLLIKTIIGLI